jgi:hypothetical protein
MRRIALLLSVCASAVALGPAGAQPPADAKVTLEAADQPTAEVVAEITKQLGVQVGIVGQAPEQVTLSLKDAAPDAAVAALAEALDASWLRSYVLESQPPAVPFTPDQLLAGLLHQRDSWFESLTEEQRQAIMALAMLSLQPGANRPQIAGAGLAKPLPTSTGPAPGGPFQGRFDAVRQIILPQRTETVTLHLDNVPLPQALFALMTASKFIVAAGGDLTGNVTVAADDRPLTEVVGQIAEAVGAQWRPIYLLSVPRVLSDAEMEEKIDEALQSRLAMFWSKPREERAREVDKWVGRLKQWGHMAQQTTPDGKPSMMNRALATVGPKALQWMTQYVAGLPQDRRLELKPIIQALGEALPK